MLKNSHFIYFIIIFLIIFFETKYFIFSVIIQIYNTGRYLGEAIFSLLNQTIGFKNIQLILVNDGSLEQSEEISLKYQKAYPNNIIYIKVEHGGVSKARNIGIEYATGKYIIFFDPDENGTLWHLVIFYYFLTVIRVLNLWLMD